MSDKRQPKLGALCTLGGWGHGVEAEYNAIAQARKPVWDRLIAGSPHGLLEASSADVGLPGGQFGNSEVGHMNLGAGRVVMQDLPRIDQAISDATLDGNAVLGAFIAALAKSGGTAHLMGLISPGGVHSHQDHIVALAKRLDAGRIPVAVHAFLDGRDTAPTNGAGYVEALQQMMREYSVGRIASASGRYYAMDRDNRWQRTQLAHDAIVNGEGVKSADPVAAIKNSYNQGVTDEFVVPIVITDSHGHPTATVRNDDAVMFFNFRADRARQMTRALTHSDFDGFERRNNPENLHYLSMTRYDKTFTNPHVFSPQTLNHILAAVMAEAQLKNLRVAETEKYAHVTYFLDGGREQPPLNPSRSSSGKYVASSRAVDVDFVPGDKLADEFPARIFALLLAFDLHLLVSGKQLTAFDVHQGRGHDEEFAGDFQVEQAAALPCDHPSPLAARRFGRATTTIRLGDVVLGGDGVVAMAAPCTVENREQMLAPAGGVARHGAHVLRGGAYKPRTSPYSFQGLGVEGLRYLAEARGRTGLALGDAVSQGGEFAFVLFAAAAAQGTMDRGIADLLVVAVTASMLLTPLAFGVHARVIAAVPKEGDRASKVRAAARELTNELEVFTKDDWIRVLEGLAIPDPEGALAVLLDANAVFEPRAGFYRAVDLTP